MKSVELDSTRPERQMLSDHILYVLAAYSVAYVTIYFLENSRQYNVVLPTQNRISLT